MLSSDRRAEHTISYRSRPYVCGAIGAWQDDLVEHLRLSAPTDVMTIHRSSSLVILASAQLGEWDEGDRKGYFWGPMASGPKPSSWRDASQAHLASGVELVATTATLHTDALGLSELYVRRIASATYFSVRLEPLVELGETPLHIDWTAWANIFAVTGPVGDQTAFQEIRRLAAASGLRSDATGIRPVSFEPDWLHVGTNDRASGAEAVEVIDSVLETAPALVTLSGGHDSRLLATLLAGRAAPAEAWTISKDDGFDWDVDLAGPVAAALGLPHRVVTSEPGSWLHDRVTMDHRLGFQTFHHVWLTPLARQVHERSGLRVYDGLAGDSLFSMTAEFYLPANLSDRARKVDWMWDLVVGTRRRWTHLFAPGVPGLLEELSRSAFDPFVDRFVDHPEACRLSFLHARSFRAIALGPLWLLGPENDVRIPFCDPRVMSYALSVSPDRKMRRVFYREMLAAASPAVAALPSTHDPEPPHTSRVPTRHQSQAALRGLADEILQADEIVRLLSPEVRLALRDPDGLAMIGGTRQGLYLLDWAARLASWHASYANRLASEGGLVVR